MEEQEASVTKAGCGDMPDGPEPVSPSEKTERASVTTGDGTDVLNRNDDNALKDCNDTNNIKVIPNLDTQSNKEISNDLDATEQGKDSCVENLQTVTDAVKEMDSPKSESINKEMRPLAENNVDSTSVNNNDDIPSGSVEISDNIESNNKSMDPIENKSALVDDVSTDRNMESDEVPKDDSISELKDQSESALTSVKNDDEDSLSIKVSDSFSKDDISKEISLSEKSDNKNEDSEAMDVDPVEDRSAEVRQNGPEEYQDDRTSTNGDTSHTKSKRTAANEETMEEDKKNSTDQDKDNRENPEFESAPETAELSHNDSQVLDPFDELLKDESSKPVGTRRSSRRTLNTTIEDDHNDTTIDDDINDSTVLDDDHTDVPDDSLVDEANVADVTEGQGADEEICLLPDTEREISEADKLKALAAKKPKEIDNTTVASAFDALVADSENKEGDETASIKLRQPKGEMSADENGENQEGNIAENELNSLHEDIDLGEDDSMRETMDVENEKDKETEEVSEPSLENLKDNIIQEIPEIQETCLQCSESKRCAYRLVIENETKHLCTKDCIKAFQGGHSKKYTITLRKKFIKEVGPTEMACIQCSNVKDCFYKISDEVDKYICGENCLKEFVGEDKERHVISRKKKVVQEIIEKDSVCFICCESKKCAYEVPIEGELKNLCTSGCVSVLQSMLPSIFRIKKRKIIKVKQTPLLKLKVISNATDKYLDSGHKMVAKTPEQVASARADRDRSFFRQCAQCQAPYLGNDKNLSWETMDFCNESCLGKYQNMHGSHCANCKNDVSITSLGKYCVRFGYDIRQFCCSGCLEEFKKGLKICCYCQRDISVGYEGFLAPVGDKGQFKDFCSQFCVEKFDQMSKNPEPPPVWARCAVCSKEKPTQLEVAIDNKNSLRLCSEPCFAAFKFVNHIFPDQCRWCNKYFERKSSESYTIYTESASHCFCTKACMNVYISNSRHIVPCNWCKVKKYNFDMIKRTLDNGQTMMMCSLNCLTLYQVSVTAVSSRRIKCDQCKRNSQAQYHLTMSDATVRNFCTYQCVMSFQGQYSKTPLMVEGDAVNKQAVPTGAPRRTLNSQRNNAKTQGMKIIEQRSSGMPVIASVQSLAAAPTPSPQVSLPTPMTRGKGKRSERNKQLQQPPVQERVPTPPPVVPPKPPTPPPPPPPKIYNHVIIKPAPPKEVKNMSTLTKPLMVTKGITCKPNMVSKEIQTEDHLQRRILIPIPVPIYVPSPMAMFSIPFPIPVPIPLPIPIPVFIPTTRNTATGIMKEIKKIHEKMPTDPFEAELLMMAEMVAGEKKKAESDSESEEEAPAADDGFSPDTMDTGNSAFGEDVLQMALKMATEYEEPAVDLESAMTASTITPSSHPNMPTTLDDNSPLHHHQLMLLEQQRAAAAVAGRKRGARALPPPSPVPAPPPTRAKRARRHEPAPPPQPAHSEPPREPQEKPDANMCLKYTFGVNAWKQWVVTKNQEMEKSTVRRKPFKSEILQLTADELNYSLCLFVKEVRKPNGSEYAPDTIYYLVLGIQQYLFENGRIDNIFTDSYYEKFTECLDEVARKFSVLYNDSVKYIVTRVEEEHLWESKQLGAHSPHVLLSTLMFFNTKHFNLVTAEEHMQLSFSHIMKHWKRNPNQPGAAKIPGSRNVLLRFYPPQSALEANSRKKKVYEQQENEENPLRCPVKLYEFYLSKCPESVKTRNDVFYLMPERSCVPDSPVWYSTQALGKEPLSKMLHRVKMVKEINIALLTS